MSLVAVSAPVNGTSAALPRGIWAQAPNPITLLKGGQLVLTVERDAGQRYQGIIALDQGSLAEALKAISSKRTAWYTILACPDGQQSAGLMLQQLPEQITEGDLRNEQWNTLLDGHRSVDRAHG